jgi:hypothetical protein
MHWALVVYSLTFIHADGRPMVATLHPAYGERECRADEVLARDELRRTGHFGICQLFRIGSTPVWPWAPDWRPYSRGSRVAAR